MTSSKLAFKDVIDTFLVPGDKNFLAYPNEHNSVKQASEKRKKSSIFVQKKFPLPTFTSSKIILPSIRFFHWNRSLVCAQ